MSIERHRRAKEIFLAACDLEAAERSAWVAKACEGDAGLRHDVESMLACDSGGPDTPGLPPIVDASFHDLVEAGSREDGGPPLPERVGQYRVLRLLGCGGMGTVYEAEQVNPRRIVALKIIRADSMTPGMLRRFEAEGQVLGRLQHPGIARIYEAGTADVAGMTRPFFAMESVRGRTITEHAADRGLSTPQRLALLVQICKAVEHAHQKGVIHRDLKPANILVDEEGQPKILDFGIARTTDSDVRSATFATQEGQIVGTLAYMSPEQASGDPGDLDSRTDVYALGAIMFELLAGRLPHEILGLPLTEAVRLIRETDPPRLDTLDRRLRGDLDTIVGKALEREKARRYPSAAALAADLARFLANEPIEARPPSRAYLFRKFVRRNRALVAGCSFTVLALIAGLVATSYEAWKKTLAEGDARKQAALASGREVEARRQADRARAVKDFILIEMLGAASPYASGADVKVIDVLDRAASRAESTFAADPDMLSAVDTALGGSYLQLGVFDKAERHLVRARDALRATLGDEARETLDAEAGLASARAGKGDPVGSLPAAREALERCRRVLGPRDPVTLGAQHNVAFLLLEAGDETEGVALMRATLAARQEMLGASNPNVLSTLHVLCAHETKLGRIEEAERLNRMALERCAAAYGPDDPVALLAKGDRADILLARRQWQDAVELLRPVLDAEKRAFGPGHLITTCSMRRLGDALRRLKDFDEADALLREVVDVRVRKLPEGHALILEGMSSRSCLLLDRGDVDAAAELLVTLVDLSRAHLPPDSMQRANNVNNLACLWYQKGDYAKAEPLFREAIEIQRRNAAGIDDQLAVKLHNLGHLLALRGDLDAAVPLFRDAVEIEKQLPPPGSPNLGADLLTLGEAYSRLGRHREAESPLREALAIYAKARDGADPDLNRVRNDLGECLLKLARPKDAEELLLTAHAALVEDAPQSTLLPAIRRNLVAVYEALGKPDDARRFASPPDR